MCNVRVAKDDSLNRAFLMHRHCVHLQHQIIMLAPITIRLAIDLISTLTTSAPF